MVLLPCSNLLVAEEKSASDYWFNQIKQNSYDISDFVDPFLSAIKSEGKTLKDYGLTENKLKKRILTGHINEANYWIEKIDQFSKKGDVSAERSFFEEHKRKAIKLANELGEPEPTFRLDGQPVTIKKLNQLEYNGYKVEAAYWNENEKKDPINALEYSAFKWKFKTLAELEEIKWVSSTASK